MTLQHTELTQIASDFVELMRSDFERSFDLRDFFRYALVRLGREVDEVELKEVAFRYFGDHYDLVCWDIGIALSFIPELEAPEPPREMKLRGRMNTAAHITRLESSDEVQNRLGSKRAYPVHRKR